MSHEEPVKYQSLAECELELNVMTNKLLKSDEMLKILDQPDMLISTKCLSGITGSIPDDYLIQMLTPEQIKKYLKLPDNKPKLDM